MQGIQETSLLKVCLGFVEYEAQAGLKIYVVNYESKAGGEIH